MSKQQTKKPPIVNEIIFLDNSYITQTCVEYSMDALLQRLNKEMKLVDLNRQLIDFVGQTVSNDIFSITDTYGYSIDSGEVDSTNTHTWSMEEEHVPSLIDNWAKLKIPLKLRTRASSPRGLPPPVRRRLVVSAPKKSPAPTSTKESPIKIEQKSVINKLGNKKDNLSNTFRTFVQDDKDKSDDEFSKRAKLYEAELLKKNQEIKNKDLEESNRLEEQRAKIRGNQQYILDRDGKLIVVKPFAGTLSPYINLNAKSDERHQETPRPPTIESRNLQSAPSTLENFISRSVVKMYDAIKPQSGVTIIDGKNRKSGPKISLDDKLRRITTAPTNQTTQISDLGISKTKISTPSNTSGVLDRSTPIKAPSFDKLDGAVTKDTILSVTKTKEDLNLTLTAKSSWGDNPAGNNSTPKVLPRFRIQREITKPKKFIIEKTIKGHTRELTLFQDPLGRTHIVKPKIQDLEKPTNLTNIRPVTVPALKHDSVMNKTSFGEKYLNGLLQS